jgi:EF-hand domain pair
VLNGKSMRRIGVAVGLLLAGGSFALAQSADDKARRAAVSGGPEVWDANHDGVYTCDEWKSYLDRMFTLADRNHDGHLDAKEFETVRKAAPMLADADFGYFDENQDGKITRSEFVTKPSEFILTNDKNGDCRVTPDEMKAAAAPGPSQPKKDRFH